MRARLTDRTLLSIKPRTERYHVGDSVVRGLRVRVAPDGSRVFSVVYRGRGGAVRTFTIGAYPEISLADARKAAKDVKASARLGTDRQEEKIAQREASRTSIPFHDLATKFLEARKQLADSTRSEYARMIARYLKGSTLGRLGAGEVTRRDLKARLEEIAGEGETETPVMANRLFQLLRAICRWAVGEELLDADPSAGVKRPRKEKSRDRVLTDTEVAAVWGSLDADKKKGRAALAPEVAGAVRVLLLLGQRSTETIEMRWSDIDDLESTTPAWTIPGEFRKGGRLHVVPLSPTVVRILKALKKTAKGPRVFSGVHEVNAERDWWGDVRKRALDLGAEHFTKHDLRRTCATGCAKLGALPWIVSRLLGHSTTQGTVIVTATYNRYSGLAEMGSALNAWGVHVERLASGTAASGKVLAMGRGRT